MKLLALVLALAACATEPDPPLCDDLGCESLSCDEHTPICTCGLPDGTYQTCQQTPVESP